MARPGSKRQIAIDLMNANADRPMAEVIGMIAQANSLSNGAARSYYVYLTENGYAQGKVDRTVKIRAEKPKAEAQPTAKEKTVKRMAQEVTAKTEAKTPEQIAEIKAANLARLKAVHAKRKQNVKREEPTEIEADPFGVPEVLSVDEVTALV